LTDDGESKTIGCNKSNVAITGSSNTITLTGHCASLTISGGDNQVVVDDVDSIISTGSGNKVTYHSGTPEVTNVGGSVIERG
jgi:Protein of unknown function (DUF3060)